VHTGALYGPAIYMAVGTGGKKNSGSPREARASIASGTYQGGRGGGAARTNNPGRQQFRGWHICCNVLQPRCRMEIADNAPSRNQLRQGPSYQVCQGDARVVGRSGKRKKNPGTILSAAKDAAEQVDASDIVVTKTSSQA